MSRIAYFLLPAFVLLLEQVPLAAQAPTHKIEATDQQTVNATITYEVRTTNFAVTRWTAFLPEPPELPSQTKVKATSTPTSKVVAEKSPLARKIRLIDVPVPNPAPGARLPLRLNIQATLRARKLVPLKEGEKAPRVMPLTAVEKKYYLGPTQQVDFDSTAVREWLDAKGLRRKKEESPLEFAPRVLEVLRETFEYRYNPLEGKRASEACQRTATDCGGMTFLFVSAMRANGVPARVLVGRLAKPRKPESKPSDPEYDQPHVRAEVYVAGIGWVPVDPAFAVTHKRQPVSEFIGNDTGDLLVLHVDVDLRLPLPGRERTADVLQIGPYYWATGRGTFDGTLEPTGWDVKTTPVGEK